MRYHPVPDYHMHTPRCRHAEGDVRDYADMAVQAGLNEIGISDHAPMPLEYMDDWRMDMDELTDYRHEVEAVQADFKGKLTVRMGLEADFRPGSEADVAAILAAWDWDYITGSVHYMDDWDFDNPASIERWHVCDIEGAYCAYFDLLARSAASGMFDIIGHPDLVKKFGHRAPDGSLRVDHAVETMLQAVKAADCALEISSAGLRKPIGEIYPHPDIITRAATLGIPFAFGSDAHKPDDVAYGMDDCLRLLESCGIHEIACFEHRVRTMIPIRLCQK